MKKSVLIILRTTSGFTLIELLLVMGIIAVLAGIIGSALDIPVLLVNSRDAERKNQIKTLENAMYQHLVDEWELVNNQAIPEGLEDDAIPICAPGVSDPQAAGCVDLETALVPVYIPSIPVDPVETNTNFSGYKVYKAVGRPRIVSVHLGTLEAPVSGSITVTPTSGLVTTEGGGTAVFSVVLDTQPTANVVIDLSSDNMAEGTVAPTSLTFTTDNWNTPQNVTVTGVADAGPDGAVAYNILTANATSGDSRYGGVIVDNVSVTNMDGSIFVTSPNGGEIWSFGNTYSIMWISTTSPPSVKIEYSVDGGVLFTVITNSAIDSGSYFWTVPYVAPSTTARIKITDTFDPNVFGISYANFTIQ